MRTEWRVLLHTGVVVAALSMTAGCGQGTPAQARDGAGSAALTAAADHLLTRTGRYYADGQVLDAAEGTLTTRCMAARGLRNSAGSAPVDRDEEWRPDLATRRRQGYGLQRAMAGQPEQDQQIRTLPPAERQRYDTALFGDRQAAIRLPDGTQATFTTRGCLAESRTRIYGSPVRAAQTLFLPQVVFNTVFDAVRHDPAYRTTMTRWSACMAGRGLHYTDPTEARQRLLAEYQTAGAALAHRHEITVAVADARCTDQVGMPRLVESLLRQHATDLPDAERAQFNAVAAVRTNSARRARRLLGR